MQPILTKKEANRIMLASGKVELTLDLGQTKEFVDVKEDVVLIRDQKLPIEDLKKIKDDTAFIVEDNHLKKMAFFADDTNLYYKLIPTSDWPTFTLSSTPMHRHTHMSPKEDTEAKISAVGPTGRVLDTCCGSGYTAIMAAKDADEVHTFEKDKNVIFLDTFNPYSHEVFTNKKIKFHKEENIFEGIKKFKDDYFDRIIHDPPTFKYAPELYSKDFYVELFRVIKLGGTLYHYAPAYQKTQGKLFYLKIVKNLKEVGFRSVNYDEQSSGVFAIK